MEIETFVIRAAAALALGLVIGIDREVKHAPVGVRTFGLVALGAAVYTMLTLQIGDIAARETDASSDPTRLIQGLIGGIGFLGAGAIIGGRSGDQVRGIASGAAIWVAGAVGVACAIGLFWEAAIVTGMVVAVLLASEYLQVKLGNRTSLDRDREDGKGSSN